MRDPVMLPTSRTIVDRSTIKSHLLSDSKDPFNRMPLAIEDVIPSKCFVLVLHLTFDWQHLRRKDIELKERIQAFMAERRNKNTALDKPEEEVVKMGVDM